MSGFLSQLSVSSLTAVSPLASLFTLALLSELGLLNKIYSYNQSFDYYCQSLPIAVSTGVKTSTRTDVT